MNDFLRAHASGISTIEFFGLVVLTSLLEIIVPRKSLAGAKQLRWLGNISSMVIGIMVVRLVFPILGFGFANLCAERGWGLLNRVTLPGWLEGGITIVVLDLGNYLRHCLSHYASVLWPLHRLHHTDDDIDFSTTLRSHPIDAVFNSATELGLIAALGAAPIAFLVFHFFSRIVDFLSHANIQVPSKLDRIFRWVIVTPAMHRIHHSQRMSETNSNYGSFLSLWDRWFGTHTAEPMGRPDQMLFGLAEFSHPKHQTLPWMLAQPFLPAKPESPSR